HGDVRNTNSLRDRGPLAVTGQVQLGGLRKAGGDDEQNERSKRDRQTSMVHGKSSSRAVCKNDDRSVWRSASRPGTNTMSLDCSRSDNVSTQGVENSSSGTHC